MLIIDVNQHKSIDSALKLYTKKIIKTKQIQELTKRKEYVKPSVKRRGEILKAVYTNNNYRT